MEMGLFQAFGDLRIKINNPFDQPICIYLMIKNVISDFRYRKIIPYYPKMKKLLSMKIISMDTDSLKKIIENKVKYKYLYEANFNHFMKCRVEL